MPDMPKRIARFIEPFRVSPGSNVTLAKDFDPAFKGGVNKKKDGAELLKDGIDLLAEYQARLAADASVFAGMRRERVEVYPVDSRVGIRAGQLLGAAHAGSELAVDAFVVAVADLAGGAVIATVDIDDLNRIANHATRVAVASIQP